MSWFYKISNSSVGMKLIMAGSGVVMVGFLVAHLSGNLLVFLGAEALTEYAKGLRKLLPLLWCLRVGIILAVILHIASAIRLSVLNKRARPISYQKKKSIAASASSRSMLLSGLTILSFIIYHLAHLTFRVTHKEFEALGPFDLYDMMIISFSSPVLSLFYSISIILLMSHLNHGIGSFFQTLGINGPKITPVIRAGSQVLSTALCVGFLSIPFSIYFGFIGAH